MYTGGDIGQFLASRGCPRASVAQHRQMAACGPPPGGSRSACRATVDGPLADDEVHFVSPKGGKSCSAASRNAWLAVWECSEALRAEGIAQGPRGCVVPRPCRCGCRDVLGVGALSRLLRVWLATYSVSFSAASPQQLDACVTASYSRAPASRVARNHRYHKASVSCCSSSSRSHSSSSLGAQVTDKHEHPEVQVTTETVVGGSSSNSSSNQTLGAAAK